MRTSRPYLEVPLPFSPSCLRKRRANAGLSVAKLAVNADVSDITVRAYEKGLRVPSVDRAARLAAALGCRVDDLLTDCQEVAE